MPSCLSAIRNASSLFLYISLLSSLSKSLKTKNQKLLIKPTNYLRACLENEKKNLNQDKNLTADESATGLPECDQPGFFFIFKNTFCVCATC